MSVSSICMSVLLKGTLIYRYSIIIRYIVFFMFCIYLLLNY